jgi:ribosomal protein L16/L10AE
MGKGKGSVDYFMGRVPANTVVLEIDYPGNPLIGLQALKVASQILPVKTSILERSTPRIIRYDN